MRGVFFNKDGERGVGVVAQEVQKVIPEAVFDGGEYLSVAYGNLVGVLVEAVKDLKSQVEELKNALPTSGSLSLNDIHLEVGGDNQDLCGMNDPDFRLLVNKGDGDQQSIIEYRGKSAAFENSEASFFLQAPIENGTWTLPGRPPPTYSSDNIDGHANPNI